MTDRELLELAAKAAGVEGEWNFGQTNCYYAGSLFYLTKPKEHTPWNSITSNGDAFRLAVKLGVSITFAYEYVYTIGDSDVNEHYGNDPYAATRRAITRAAAEIGRQMK